MILERDEDFIASTLADLAHPERGSALISSIAATPSVLKLDGEPVLKLFQPIQRRFHLALIEAWCDQPGSPRLDPAAVAAAGLVVRRLIPRRKELVAAGLRSPGEEMDQETSQPFHHRWVVEGWMRSGDQVLGWIPLTPEQEGESDPSPGIRASAQATGVDGLDRLLLPLLLDNEVQSRQEDVMPMFAAPPETAEATGHTYFYGLVSTASQERATAAADLEEVMQTLETGPDFTNHLVSPLRGSAFTFPAPPRRDRRIDHTWKASLERLASQDAPIPSGSAGGPRGAGPHWLFRQLLMQLAVEFGAFAEGSSGGALQRTLRRIRLPCAGNPHRSVPADRFLEQAVRILLDGEKTLEVEMPLGWPPLDANLREDLRQGLLRSLRERLGNLAGRSGRYEKEGALYVIRTFLRLKPRDGCPPRTVWSGYSKPFVIAAWYESAAGSDPIAISLPDVSDRNQLRSLKPNVSFVVPGKLADLLQSDGSDLLEGKSSGRSLGIQWICGFSLPIITLCAFIVLNIFLSLLNIFLGWLLYVKVCLPFPKK